MEEKETQLGHELGEERLLAQQDRELLCRLRCELKETTALLGTELQALEDATTDHDEIARRHGEDLVDLRLVADRNSVELTSTHDARHEFHDSLTEMEQAVRERRLETERLNDRLAKSHRALTDSRRQTQPLEVSQTHANDLVLMLWVSKIWQGYLTFKRRLRGLLPTLHDSLANRSSETPDPPDPPEPRAEAPSVPVREATVRTSGVRRRVAEWWEIRKALGRSRRRERDRDRLPHDGSETAQGPIDRDKLLDLLERDKVIVTLKKVIVERERRIELLETQLAVVTGQSVDDPSTPVGVVAVPSNGRTASVTEPSDSATMGGDTGLVPVHGVYDDGWLSTDAVFRIGHDLRGKTLRLGMWLPRTYRGSATKSVRFEVEGGVSTQVELTRDQEFMLDLTIPAGDGDLRLRVITDALESPRLRDIRQLGVRLTRWEGVEQSAV